LLGEAIKVADRTKYSPLAIVTKDGLEELRENLDKGSNATALKRTENAMNISIDYQVLRMKGAIRYLEAMVAVSLLLLWLTTCGDRACDLCDSLQALGMNSFQRPYIG
jgi:hypothetical protein